LLETAFRGSKTVGFCHQRRSRPGIVGRFGETSLDVIEKVGFAIRPVCRTCIAVSHPYGPAPLAGPPALQEPREATGCIRLLRRVKNLRGNTLLRCGERARFLAPGTLPKGTALRFASLARSSMGNANGMNNGADSRVPCVKSPHTARRICPRPVLRLGPKDRRRRG
jgi:hypothetical protein